MIWMKGRLDFGYPFLLPHLWRRNRTSVSSIWISVKIAGVIFLGKFSSVGDSSDMHLIQVGVTAITSNVMVHWLFGDPINGPLQFFGASLIINGLTEVWVKHRRECAESAAGEPSRR